jgi:hypothetical protein
VLVELGLYSLYLRCHLIWQVILHPRMNDLVLANWDIVVIEAIANTQEPEISVDFQGIIMILSSKEFVSPLYSWHHIAFHQWIGEVCTSFLRCPLARWLLLSDGSGHDKLISRVTDLSMRWEGVGRLKRYLVFNFLGVEHKLCCDSCVYLVCERKLQGDFRG